MATDYGKRLKQARKHARLTQEQLSAKTSIPQSTISTAERLGQGSSETPVYAKVCGVDAHWLATGEGSMLPGGTDAFEIAPAGVLCGNAPPLLDFLKRLSAELLKLPQVQHKMALSSMRDFAEHPENWQQLAAELQVLGVNMGLPAAAPQEDPVPEEAAPVQHGPAREFVMGKRVLGGEYVDRRTTPGRRSGTGS